MHSIRVLLTLSLLQSCSFGRSLIDLSARGALCENKFLVNQPCNFVSENFTTTGLFPLDTVCSYTVFADSNQVIKLKFSTLSLVDGDKVSVYNGDTSSPDSLIGE